MFIRLSFYKLHLALLFSVFTLFLHSQNIKFRAITTDQGLSVSYVQSIIQDYEGFMWFATQDGLNKYDGYEMKVYRNNPKDKASLNNNDILALYQDKEGIIWIGTNIRCNK
jgi:ligand-binding sensor domain-containing protein